MKITPVKRHAAKQYNASRAPSGQGRNRKLAQNANLRPPAVKFLSQVAMETDEKRSHMTFESLSRTSAFIFVFVYLCGFIVVTCHLARYGISFIALLKAQYIVAGFWVLSPFLLVYFVFASIGWALSIEHKWRDRGPPPTKRFRFLLWRILLSKISPLTIFLCATLLILVQLIPAWIGLGYDPEYIEHHLTRVVVFLGFLIVIVWAITQVVSASVEARAGVGSSDWESRHFLEATFHASLAFLVFLAYVLLFARRIYPLIPYTLGGGKPLNVTFLLKSESSQETPFLRPDASGKRSVPYRMLLATDKTFVVVSPDEKERCLEFNRDAVMGVVVLKDSSFSEAERTKSSAPSSRLTGIHDAPPARI